MALTIKKENSSFALIILCLTLVAVVICALTGSFWPLPLYLFVSWGLLFFNLTYFIPNYLLKKKIEIYTLYSVLLVFVLTGVTYLAVQWLKTSFKPSVIITFFLFYAASFLLGGIWALTREVYRKEKVSHRIKVQHQESELQFLRAQLNPHFLFNSLNSIYSLVLKKSSEAPNAVITLSELMRYMVYEADREKVPLAKEIEYIQNFVQLQIIRLSNSEDVKINIRGSYENKKITPLLLMPFIENAFKHGTDFKGKTDVSVLLEVIEDDLFFKVKNKIRSNKKDDESFGIGLQNIRSTLELVYPEAHILNINEDNGYYDVELQLNLA